ncbi:MAG: hypothetical protein GY839_15690 [candidate division Zixibacteria bacterium]|nr:hypothetical protein [candidate division Zixibacteria bacterium]
MLSNEELENLRLSLEERLKVKIRAKRIKAIRVNSSFHWQPPLFISVGGLCANLEKDSPPEDIIAIFEHASFVVVTPQRGLEDNTLPYFFARQDVKEVIEA